MAKPWLVLTHTHSYWKVRVHHEDVLDALPAGASLALDLVEFHDEQPDVPVAEIAWREEQIRQARLWDSKKDMVVNQCKASPMAYFGATFIPLAMDLGQRLMTWRSPAVYQQHHHEKHWRWTGRPEGMTGPGVTIDGVPPEIDSRPGDVVLRIAASYPIDPSKTRSVLPNPLAELDLKLCPIALDPFATPAELEQMVVAFHGALRVIQERLPNARRLHLFLAGPVGRHAKAPAPQKGQTRSRPANLDRTGSVVAGSRCAREGRCPPRKTSGQVSSRSHHWQPGPARHRC